MFTAEDGFLLTDALISVFIVAIIASLVSAALLSHYHTAEMIREELRKQEDQDTQALSQTGVCNVCQESTAPDIIPEE